MRSPGKFWLEPIQGYDPWRQCDGFRFDARAAGRVCGYIEKHTHHGKGEWAGRPFMLEPWQRRFIGHAFGWKRKDGTRRYRKIFVYVPRKNGKTTVVAAIGIVLMVADGEPGAEIYCAAADGEQATIVFRDATGMVRQDAELSEEIRVYEGYKAMKYEATQSYWRVLSSEAKTKHGLNPHGYIIDEVHAQRKTDLIEALETGVGARKQPLGLYMTTADVIGPSVCNSMYAYGKGVRDGTIDDPTFLPVIYEALPEDDWTSEETWRKANPNYGISVKPDYLREQCKKAVGDPAFENSFKRLHLNMQTEQERRWLQVADWDKSGQALMVESLAGMPCHGSIDLSSVSDITCFSLWFPEVKAFLPWFWVPEETAKKKIEYELWARQGYVTIGEGRVLDTEDVRAKIKEISGKYRILNIAYDAYNAAQLALKLGKDDGFEMVEFRQGFASMNEPSKEVEKMVIRHEINHFGNPVMRWMVSNVQVATDKAANIKPVKPNKDSPQKIDGVVCLVMGVGLGMVAVPKEEPFKHGITFL